MSLLGLGVCVSVLSSNEAFVCLLPMQVLACDWGSPSRAIAFPVPAGPPRFPPPPTLTDAFSRVAGRRGRSERTKQNEPLPGLNSRAPGPKRAAHSFPTYAGREPTRTQWAPLRPIPLRPADRCSTAYQIMLDPSGRAGCKGKVRGSVYHFRWCVSRPVRSPRPPCRLSVQAEDPEGRVALRLDHPVQHVRRRPGVLAEDGMHDHQGVPERHRQVRRPRVGTRLRHAGREQVSCASSHGARDWGAAALPVCAS